MRSAEGWVGGMGRLQNLSTELEINKTPPRLGEGEMK